MSSIDANRQLAVVEAGAKQLLAEERKHAVHIATYTSKFYAAPSFKGMNFDASNKMRWLSVPTYNQRSTMLHEPHDYDRFLLRALSRSTKINKAVGKFQRSVAFQSASLLQKVRPMLDSKSVSTIVANYVYNGKGNVDTLFGDLYRLLMGRKDLLNHECSGLPEYELLQTIKNSPDFMRLKGTVGGDPARAAVAAVMLLERDEQMSNCMSAAMAVSIKTQADKCQAGDQEQEDDQEQENEDEGGSGEKQKKSGAKSEDEGSDEEGASDSEDGDSNGEKESEADSADADNKEQARAAKDAVQKLRVAIEDAVDCVANAVTTAVCGDSDESKKLRDLGGEFAGTEMGTDAEDPSNIPQTMRLAELLLNGEFTDDHSQELSRLFDALGRVESLFHEAITASRQGDGDVLNVTQGGDATRMIGSEYIPMVAGMDALFYARLAEEQLLQYERRGVDDAGRGPVIILLDISHSMSYQITLRSRDGYSTTVSRKTAACAFAVALTKYSVKWGRSVAIIPFESKPLVSDSFIHVGSKKELGVELGIRLEHVCAMSTRGGTSFENALYGAYDVLKKMPAFDDADIIFFTDGCSEDRYSNVKSKKGNARIFGLMITSESQDALKRLEKDNEEMFFDVGIATTGNAIGEGISRLFEAILSKSFYEGMNESSE